MCGIMGYFCFGEVRPNKKEIENMFTLLESRGRDASGFAYTDKTNLNDLIVMKAPVKASQLITTEGWKQLRLPQSMIFHTRMKTQGEPANNMNNHPLFSKKGIALVHNGMIFNDDEIFTKGMKRDAEVDSEAILALLSQHTKGDKIKLLFDMIEGSFALAMISKDRPDKLTLIRKDNPLDIYYDCENDILYFCSEQEIMQEALGIKPRKQRGFPIGEGNFHSYEVENNHAMIINGEGLRMYKPYKPKPSNFFRCYRDYSYPYADDLEDDIIEVECPFCLSITKYNWVSLFNRCEHCGSVIDERDLSYV